MNNSLKKIVLRIIEISYNNKLSHIGSCVTAAQIIYDIYEQKRPNEVFILSSGHAYLAQLVVMEHFGIIKDAEKILLQDGMHPKRNLANSVYLSTGSLGMGLPVAVGVALARPNENIYCLVSDGEMAEGSIWESLYFINNKSETKDEREKLKNLNIYININGMSALDHINQSKLVMNLQPLNHCNINLRYTKDDVIYTFDFMKDLKAHYQVLTKQQYEEIRNYYQIV